MLALRPSPTGSWPTTDVEMPQLLDITRILLAATADRRGVPGPTVGAIFIDTANIHGLPRPPVTDNGAVYTARFTHGHNEFDYYEPAWDHPKNGHPVTRKPKAKSNAVPSTQPSNAASGRPTPADTAARQCTPCLDTPHLYNTDAPTAPFGPHHPGTGLHRTNSKSAPPATPHRPSTTASARSPSMPAANSPCVMPSAYIAPRQSSPPCRHQVLIPSPRNASAS